MSASAHNKIVRFGPGCEKEHWTAKSGHSLFAWRSARVHVECKETLRDVPAGLAYCPRGVAEGRSVQPASSHMETVGGALIPAVVRRRRILLFIKCMGYGGAEQLLVHMVRHGDRDRFDYEVAYMLEDFDALVPQLTDAGVPVHSLGAASNRDLGWTLRLRGLAAAGRLRCHALAPAPRGNARAHGCCRQHDAEDAGRHSSTPSTACGTRCQSLVKVLNRATIGLDDRLVDGVAGGQGIAATVSAPPRHGRDSRDRDGAGAAGSGAPLRSRAARCAKSSGWPTVSCSR